MRLNSPLSVTNFNMQQSFSLTSLVNTSVSETSIIKDISREYKSSLNEVVAPTTLHLRLREETLTWVFLRQS